jgi:hypothetical protein
LLAGAALAALGAAGAIAQDCDRACLIGVTDAYLAALVAHDPSAAPLAGSVAFVENVTRMQPGEGLWASATGGPTEFRIYVPDVDQQQAGWMGVMERDGQPVLLALRLKLDAAGKIVEAEHLVAGVGGPAGGEPNLSRLTTPRPGLVSEIPDGQRKSHDELIAIGATYYDALDDNDGTKMPFAADCQRHENGMVTAGPEAGAGPNANAEHPVARDCAGQLSSKSFVYIDRIENRRMIAADPVTGLAMGLSHFRHPFDNLPYEVIAVDGTKLERNAENMPYQPFDMPAAHIFKIGADGLVHEIEAVGILGVPYNSPTGWE